MPSTVIKGYEYNEATRSLIIEFVSGNRYRYLNIDKTVIDAFKNYREKGVFYNREIKGKYAYEKLTGL